MKESFSKENSMGTEHFYGLIMKSMRGSGLVIKNMGKESIFILMEEFIKEISWMIYLMVLEL